MKKMKRQLALFLSFIMVFMLTVSAYADNSDSEIESGQIEIATPSNADIEDWEEIASSSNASQFDDYDEDEEEWSNHKHHDFRPATGSNWGPEFGGTGGPASGNSGGPASPSNWGTASGSNWELASGSNAMKYTICPYCNEEAVDGVITHKAGCPETCTCGSEDGIHDEDCPLYEAIPDTAEVYLLDKNGGYIQIDEHGVDTPLDMEVYDGLTLFVQESDNEQNIYFELYEDYLDVGDSDEEFGAKWSVNKDTKAQITESGKLTGDTYRYATVTLDTNNRKGDVIKLSAQHADFGDKEVTIEVVDTVEGLTKLVTVDGTSIKTTGNIPADVKLEATAFEMPAVYSRSLAENTPKLAFAFDITLKNADGTVWQPAEGETVTVTLDANSLGLEDGTWVEISHEHGDELKDLGIHIANDGRLFFETDGFSVFYGYIVDFEYNGYKFSINGGEEVLLSDLLEALEIERDIDTVTNVRFSDSSLIEIDKEDEEWVLTSLSAFGTVEWLYITFEDGTTIEIRVTDPVLKYYLDGTDWCMETFTGTITSNNNNTVKTDVVINKDAITGASLGNTHENKDDGTKVADLIIYTRPGMAIRFDRYSSFSNVVSDGNWTWIWGKDNDSAGDQVGYNYVLIDEDISEVTTIELTVPIGDHPEGDGKQGEYIACEITIIVVPDAAQPTLLKAALESADDSIRSKYSIRELPVTLYDYDGNKLNEAFSGDHFSFKGVSKGEKVSIEDGNLTDIGDTNGGGPVMGILENELDANGLPVMTQGAQVDLFSKTGYNWKKVNDVNFEFVYDTDGYYTYSSDLNHAQYNEEKDIIELYREAMGTTASYALHGSSENYAAGGFYPYADINKAADSAGSVYSWEDWEHYLTTGYNMEKPAAPFGKDLVNSAVTAQPYSTVDMHNGLQLSANFYLPENKTTEEGADIVYQFTGDDDLWVFINNKIVLDIGGGHTPVSGTINFTTGTVQVEGNYYKIGDSNTYENYTENFEIAGDQIHSLKIFYLERYGGVSNCRMRFNLPLVPSDVVNVSKNLVNQEGKEMTVTPDVEYTFTMYTASDDDDNVDATSFSALANAEYTVTGAGAPTEPQRTDENGQFRLKDGWIASFAGIPRFTEVYVVEARPNDGYQYVGSTVSVNKATEVDYTYGEKTETKVMMLNSSINFDFVNKMQTQPLIIEKQVVNGEEGLLDSAQKFNFTLDFTKNILETGNGAISAEDKSGDMISLTDGESFQLAQNESITLPRVPVNMTYTVSETNPDSVNNSFDAPVFAATLSSYTQEPLPTEFAFDAQYGWTMADGGENKILVTNQQRFDLTISKSGIEDVDHHPKTSNDADDAEAQSTIYEVTGPNNFKMQVAICGNDSVTIKKLLVGNYTVKELTDWSWRYEVENGTRVEVSVDPDEFNEQVTYKNTRKNPYWLSGDSYAKNWWGGGSVVRKDED